MNPGVSPRNMGKDEISMKLALMIVQMLCGLFLIIHCRVIAACLTGIEMPEAPAWHKKCFHC